MEKMMAMLLASVMAVGTFTTTAFAYTGDAAHENTAVSLSLIHISEPTRPCLSSRMPSSA